MGRSGLTGAIRDVLRPGQAMTVTEVVDAVRRAGFEDAEDKNVRSLISQRHAAGEFAKRPRGNMVEFYPDPGYTPPNKGEGARLRQQREAEANPEPPAPVFGPSMGMVVTKRAAPERREREDSSEVWELDRDNIEAVLRNGGATLDELLGQLDSTRAELSPVLHDAVEAGHLGMHYSRGERANVYFLPDPRAGEDDGEGPLPPLPESAYPPHAAPLPETAAAADPATRFRAPCGLRDRLAAIVTDLEDAIGDACDAQAPHDLIKALVLANGSANRAMRVLGA